ncbi:unnamed protein product, partial [Ceratitis capitata]
LDNEVKPHGDSAGDDNDNDDDESTSKQSANEKSVADANEATNKAFCNNSCLRFDTVELKCTRPKPRETHF